MTGQLSSSAAQRPGPGQLVPLAGGERPLRLRWLGHRAHYRDAHALQRALWSAGPDADDWLLLLEHPHVFTAGIRSKAQDMLEDPAAVGAELLWVDRGGEITYHGPGQLVGYPIVTVANGPGAAPAYVHELEELVIGALGRLGLHGAGRLAGHPGVWLEPDGPRSRKICAIGARNSRRRTMHGFALNVRPDLAMFERIVPCGIVGKGVTSLAAEGFDSSVEEAVEAVFAEATERWGMGRLVERQDVAFAGSRSRPGVLSGAPAEAHPGAAVEAQPLLPRTIPRKPVWLRANAHMGPEYRSLQRTARGLGLVTVCEEAGCPNIYECWADGTATFMINGERCTRACGFCQVSSGKPLPPSPDEPERVAEAVAHLGLSHAVVTCVARDDLADGGAAGFAATIDAIRRRCPGTAVEVLISDLKGDPGSLAVVFDRHPDVLNHNVETVPRLQRLVRPSASYLRSLAVLASAARAGLVTKSGLMVGLGEREDEVVGALADLHGAGVRIVTIGQYLRPGPDQLPVARWWSPEEFARLADKGRALGITEVVASPLTRSSYHARQAAAAAGGAA